MQERQMFKTHDAQEKKVNDTFIFFGQDGHIYGFDGEFPCIQISCVSDPATWDLPHVYPKKRNKRKKGFDRDAVIRVARVKNR